MTSARFAWLTSLILGSCVAQQNPVAVTPCPSVTPASATSGEVTEGATSTAAAPAPSPAVGKLETSACEPRAFGCASCAAEGVWGALRVESDCTLHCDRICGNQPAKAPPANALGTQMFGPNLVDMKVQLPSEISVPRKSDSIEKKPSSTKSADDMRIVEKSSSFSVAASRDTVNCGLLGRANATVTCNPPTIAHCGCEAVGTWGKAQCECRPPSPSAARWSTVNDCHIDAQPQASCPAAGLLAIDDPGCATHCPLGYAGVCKAATCTANTWTQSLCGCVPH